RFPKAATVRPAATLVRRRSDPLRLRITTSFFSNLLTVEAYIERLVSADVAMSFVQKRTGISITKHCIFAEHAAPEVGHSFLIAADHTFALLADQPEIRISKMSG